MFANKKNLFPNYKIYCDKSEGIEYSIENHRIDVHNY